MDIPITRDYRATHDTTHYRTEHRIRVESPSVFRVTVRRVNVSSRAILAGNPKAVRFSEGQYAIPNSPNIRLRTAAYYRDWEETDGCGIGDAEEATLRRNTNLAAFQREAGQIPTSCTHNVQLALTQRKECWVLCTSIAPTPLTGLDRMRASVCQGYDAATLIADSSEFARQLGLDFGNALRPGDLDHPGPMWWTLRPKVFVDHGPVMYADFPSDVIERFPNQSWGLVTPFVKRTRFSEQNEYRFVISTGGLGDPQERSLDLMTTAELRALTHLIE